MEFYRVEMPYYTAGFWVDYGRIVESAPIMSWAVGRSLENFMQWVYNKGGKVSSLGEEITAELRNPHTTLAVPSYGGYLRVKGTPKPLSLYPREEEPLA